MSAGVAEAAGLSAELDKVLGDGFARLGPDHVASLERLAATFAGTPLGGVVSQAVSALAAGELLAHHLAALALARSALEGARFDALLAQAAEELGYSVEQPELEAPTPPSPEAALRMESARQWLVEIALAGLCQLDNATVVPVVHTLDGVQQSPELAGLAAMLTGFVDELLDHTPTSALPEPPLRRWGDLWSRCLLASFALPERPAPRSVDGELRVLGAELRHHDHVLSVLCHGLLVEGDTRRLVRCTLNAWKVDAIAGAETWNLVRPLAPELVDSLARPKRLQLSGCTLRGADLVLDGTVAEGAAFDPFAEDLCGALLVAPPPRDRHPIQLALPALHAGKPEGTTLERLSPHADLDADEVDKSATLLALYRYDEGWSWQPLAGRAGKKVFGPAEGIAAAAKVKAPALDILRERASQLLRSH